MNNEFDFKKIGKKIPYSVPDRFFDDITKQTLEKARQRERNRKIRKSLVMFFAAASVLILVTIGFLLLPGRQDQSETTIVQSVNEEKILQQLQPEELVQPDSAEIEIDEEPKSKPVIQSTEPSIEKLIAEMSDEELKQLEIVINGELFLNEIIND